MKMRMSYSLMAIGALTCAQMCSQVARAQDWPDVFPSLQMLRLNLEMEQADWEIVQQDETFDIEVEAMFWADGEAPILVSVRRKSADPIQEGTPFVKVSLKIDINEYVSGQAWHGLKKLSIENGDDEDVVSECAAWQLHRLASGPEGYGYLPGLASWVTVNINGIDTGVYVNVEQPDKRYLQNRDTYQSNQTWLYKVSDQNQPDMKVGGPEDSPTFLHLCYEPFGTSCSAPDQQTIVEEVPEWANLQGLLTLGAVTQFTAGGDALFTAGKNFYFADFTFGPKRRYYPWDLDSHLSGNGTSHDIYGGGADYAALLSIPEFRSQYSQIMHDLMCGPMRQEAVFAFLDAAEVLITPDLEADPNNQLDGSVAERFDSLRNWFEQRYANVADQLEGFDPCTSNPADLNGDSVIDVSDLLLVLEVWGSCKGSCPPACFGDINADCEVGVDDLLIIIAAWS